MRARRFALAILLAGATAGCGARSDLADALAPGLVCKGSALQPVLLETIGVFPEYDRATAITVTGGEVYYSVNDGSDVVTSDACNVYWVAGIDFDDSNPPALFARGR